jgi:hypothetical protein
MRVAELRALVGWLTLCIWKAAAAEPPVLLPSAAHHPTAATRREGGEMKRLSNPSAFDLQNNNFLQVA